MQIYFSRFRAKFFCSRKNALQEIDILIHNKRLISTYQPSPKESIHKFRKNWILFNLKKRAQVGMYTSFLAFA